MIILLILAGAALFALIVGPQFWIKWVMTKHAVERKDFPGTGGELARHLLKEAGVENVRVEITEAGDHYSPSEKIVRLSKANFEGMSVTAAAVAAHEVGHALQDRDGYLPLHLRQRLVGYAVNIERVGSALMMASPIVFMLTRSPLILLAEVVAALGILSSSVVIHLVTLPTEFDASYKRALPVLANYLRPEDMPAARSVLTAAAFTYVAGALVTLLNIARWLRLLRF